MLIRPGTCGFQQDGVLPSLSNIAWNTLNGHFPGSYSRDLTLLDFIFFLCYIKSVIYGPSGRVQTTEILKYRNTASTETVQPAVLEFVCTVTDAASDMISAVL
jgi:hypothetical protein